MPSDTDSPVAFWFYRHAEIPSHRGDLPATSGGLRRAEEVGRTLAANCPAAGHVEFLHAPTIRTVQTAEALRRGIRRGVAPGAEIELGTPRVEPAIRNPDLYVAGHRVEMVSTIEAVAAQLPHDALTRQELEANAFFSRFVTAPDRVGLWIADDDPPGERADDVARRFITWARSLCDTRRPYARRYVCVTHSGPLRAVVRRYVLDEDPGEPEYVEPVELTFDGDNRARWRFRDVVTAPA
jgi:broad specificity phosphatase PhoE